VWGWVAPFQNAFVGKVGNGLHGRAENGRGVGIIQMVWGWVAPFQNAFVGKIGNGLHGGRAENGRGVGIGHPNGVVVSVAAQ
jgi:hypothetical protein